MSSVDARARTPAVTDDPDLTHKARTLAAYVTNLAQGAVLADFEIDNIIALSKAVGVDVSMYRDNMSKHAIALAAQHKNLEDARRASAHFMDLYAREAARPWWKKLLGIDAQDDLPA